MLVNCVSPELCNVNTLALLAMSNYTFYQTGSRYFGTETAESDWDFFTAQYDEGGFSTHVEEFLQKHGFKRCGKEQAEKYNDNITCGVYEKDNVHVQLVMNINRKIAMQKILKDTGVLNTRVDKAVAKQLWKVAYHATSGVI